MGKSFRYTLILTVLSTLCCLFTATLQLAASSGLRIGLEVLATQHPEFVRGKRIALLTGASSYDQALNHSIDRLSKAAVISVIFSGETYFRETIPGNSPNEKFDALTNAAVIEIRDPLQRPQKETLGDAELIVIDVQDIGIRYFNYVTLLAQFLDLAREAGLPVILLDRPNPMTSELVSGPVLSPELRSRFGVYPIPLVYGMTFGELALYFNKTFGLEADLTVIGMEGYRRTMTFNETGLYWGLPATHLPQPDSALFYAVTGFLGEMGVFSTGVGTVKPFQYILAPWIDGELLRKSLNRHRLPGVDFVAVTSKPFYGLFQQQKVSGIEIVIRDRRRLDPFLTGLAILRSLWELYPEKIPLHNPTVAEALDTILGDRQIRKSIVSGLSLMGIFSPVAAGVSEFKKARRSFLIYH